MANIRVDVNYAIKDGSEIVFRSPTDCSAITGLVVYYTADDGSAASKEFALADAHGHNVGDIDHLFAENAVVKVILDVTHGMAFVQNADTNAYLEARLAEMLPRTELDEAINDALAQAKASGEFDGVDGRSIYPCTYTGTIITSGNGMITSTHESNYFPHGLPNMDDLIITAHGYVCVVTSVAQTTVNSVRRTMVSYKFIANLNGAKGEKGEPGEKGDTVTQGIQGEKGEKGDKGNPGEQGEPGKDGKDGADGKTPVKGVDYYTDADKAEMVSAVCASLPVYQGEVVAV